MGFREPLPRTFRGDCFLPFPLVFCRFLAFFGLALPLLRGRFFVFGLGHKFFDCDFTIG